MNNMYSLIFDPPPLHEKSKSALAVQPTSFSMLQPYQVAGYNPEVD